MRVTYGIAVLGLGLGLATAANAATMLKSEPALGTLKAGNIYLVDDNSCPSGQIKKIVAGDNRRNIARQTSCVPYGRKK